MSFSHRCYCLVLIYGFVHLLSACQPHTSTKGANTDSNALMAKENPATDNHAIGYNADVYNTIEWIALLPPEDWQTLLNPPSYIDEVVDGSIEDQIASQVQGSMAAAYDDAYQKALVSTDIVEAMDGAKIRIPGFIVPVEFDDNQRVTQFFLVPYFGACLHLPPPPPNQIIYVKYPKGLNQQVLEQPFWISGELSASIVNNDIATAAYSMQMVHAELYEDF